jgi:hypothetical protein
MLLSKQAIKTEWILNSTPFATGIFDLILLAIELCHSYFAHLIL